MSGVLELVGARALPLLLSLLRLGPVVFLCPLLGGRWVPPTVRFGVAATLAFLAQQSVALPWAPSPTTLLVWVGREVALGLGLGFLALLPFEAARMGGRWVDTFRGSTAEVALPGTGVSEAATAELFHLLWVALAAELGAIGRWVEAVLQTFRTFPLGEHGALSTDVAVAAVGATFAAGLAIGAPIAALALLGELLVALLSRWLPALQLAGLSAPLRLLAGGAVAAVLLGDMNARVLGDLSNALARFASMGGAP